MIWALALFLQAAPPAEPPKRAVDVGIAAICGQDTVTWSDLRPILNERAGAAALEEALLDKRVHAAAQEQALAITEEMLRDEERVLREQLSTDPARADRLLDEVRQRQGLGPTRWRALLWRNAALRQMVAKDVQVLPQQVEAALDAAHGPRRSARIIAVPDLKATKDVADRLAKGDSFADIATAVSTDASAPRGGLIAPVSRLDPAFPAAFREALWSLDKPGGVSAPVLVTTGYVIVRYEGDVPGDPAALEAARPKAAAAVRLAQERARMEELARSMVRGAKPTIFDESLADSWNRANAP